MSGAGSYIVRGISGNWLGCKARDQLVRVPFLLFLLVVGVGIGACFVLVSGVELKGAILLSLVVVGVACWPISAFFPGVVEKLLLFGLAFTLSISLKKHLAFRTDHIGGAIGWRLSITEVLIFALVATFVLHRRREGFQVKLDRRIFCVFALYLAIAVLSAFFGNDSELGFFQVSALIQAFVLFVFLLNYLTTAVRLRIFLAGMLIGLATQSAVAIAQGVRPGALNLRFLGAAEEEEARVVNGQIDLPDVDRGTTLLAGNVAERPSGMLIHPNVLALYLALTIPVAIAVLLADHSWRRGVLALAVLGLSTGALYLTLSRSGWLGLGIALVVGVAWWIRQKPFRLTLGKKAILLAVVLAGAVGAASQAQRIYLRLTENADEALDFRRNLGAASWRMVEAHPFLGVGLNSFETVVDDYDTTTMSRYKRFPVHNILLLEISETGVLGAIAFITLWVVILRQIFKEANQCQSPVWKVLAFSLGCGVIGFFAGDMSNFVYRNPIMTSMVWAQAGLALAAARIGKRPPQERAAIWHEPVAFKVGDESTANA